MNNFELDERAKELMDTETHYNLARRVVELESKEKPSGFSCNMWQTTTSIPSGEWSKDDMHNMKMNETFTRSDEKLKRLDEYLEQRRKTRKAEVICMIVILASIVISTFI